MANTRSMSGRAILLTGRALPALPAICRACTRFTVDGMPTTVGSQLDLEDLLGAEGKTVEFAFGPTSTNAASRKHQIASRTWRLHHR
jgi:hypothetical protein